MSDDIPLYRKVMEGAATFMSHWEGVLIVLMFSVLLGFTLAFLTTVYMPFTDSYPPPTATHFNVTGEITGGGTETTYRLQCGSADTLRRYEEIPCTYSIDTSGEPEDLAADALVHVTWWPFTGSNTTRALLHTDTVNTTGNISFHAPKQAERYLLDVDAADISGAEHTTSLHVQGEEKTFRVFTDRQALSIIYRLLVLTFNIIVLTSIWFSAGEVAVELLERIDRREMDSSDQDD